jgi:HlyD family secretion protein
MNYEARLDMTEGSQLEDLSDGTEETSFVRRKRKPLIALGVVLLAIIAAALMLTGGDEPEPFTGAGDVTPPAITVIVPGRGTVAGVINATGTLAARREMPVGVVGEGGRVVSVPVEPGQWVSAGQVLAVIDRSVQVQQSASSAAQIDVARADAELAEANLQRALQLVERGFISQADIDRLTATRDAARARVSVAQAQFGERQARNAQLNIVAPAAGLLLTRAVEPGQVVSPGSGVLFSIARGGEMELLANVGEGELSSIPVGATGAVTPAGTTESFTCSVWQKSPVINEQTRQGVARCAMSYNAALRPGGFATVQLGGSTQVAARLPESALLSDEQGSYVYIIDNQNKVVRRPVELGAISDEGIVVTSGLQGTERVVARAGGFLNPGEVVRPVTGNGAE